MMGNHHVRFGGRRRCVPTYGRARPRPPNLLRYAVRLLAEHPHRLALYRQRWRWLVVDEFQDTNEAQAALIHLLAGPTGNVCVVGDDDQCLLAGTEVTMADGHASQSRPSGRATS